MQIRHTSPPQIVWKERVGDRWVGRTLTVNAKNLEAYGIAAPASRDRKAITPWHAKRLLNVLRDLERETREKGHDRLRITLREMIDIFLTNMRVAPGFGRRRERALRSGAKITIDEKGKEKRPPNLKHVDISLLSSVGDLPLRSITSEHVLRHQRFLESQGYAPMSVRGFLLDVRALFNYAVRHNYLDRSPAERVTLPPSEPTSGLRFLSQDQIDKLLEIAGDPLKYDPDKRNHLERSTKKGRSGFLPAIGNNVISQVLPGFLYLGVRRSELCRIRWSDVDFERGIVRIRGARKNPARVERIRELPIPNQFLPFLSSRPRTSEFVFTNSTGKPWNVNSLGSALRHFVETHHERLGFDFDFQTLRRTYGSTLYGKRLSMDQIATFLGHSDVSTTRTWYVSLKAEDLREKVTAAFASRSGRKATAST